MDYFGSEFLIGDYRSNTLININLQPKRRKTLRGFSSIIG
jgi:hypothetical protein